LLREMPGLPTAAITLGNAREALKYITTEELLHCHALKESPQDPFAPEP